MFDVIRAAIRAFAVGVAVGVLFAPRAGAETRSMLSRRLAEALDQILDVAALPPIPPERVRTNGHPEAHHARRTRAAGSNARTT